MQVHWGSRDRDGDAGVDSGFLLAFTFCLGGSNRSEYDDEALRENLNDGDCKQQDLC